MTASQLIESENGTELAAALDNFAALCVEYNAGTHTAAELHVLADKLATRLNELGLDNAAPLELPA